MLVCCPTLVEAARGVLAGVGETNRERVVNSSWLEVWRASLLAACRFRTGIDFASVCHTLGQRAGTLQRLQPLERLTPGFVKDSQRLPSARAQ